MTLPVVILSEQFDRLRRAQASRKMLSSRGPGLGPRDLLFGRQEERIREINPCRIVGLDQRDFLLPAPSFDLLLARNGVANIAEDLVMYEAMNPISFGESGDQTFPVLSDPSL